MPHTSSDVVWTAVTADSWSAAQPDGTLLGDVARTDRYFAHSADDTVTGTHSSLESARSQIEAHGRWLHSLTGK
ncbi:hypothetical protein [Curtobacterium sp. MCSS17_005]|uniref:hypothetical protein n=1 Tax=Curtobacterium sp. MCSS17_005 TaxID=2175641 RepID=UPI0011B665FB|nr:hypothetical protein [Curtobacterium sp. MCSS17_005]WIB33086.1 hypothetical protein DEJ20_01120 [Curtobacterium sp. MCSS17_005]